MDFIKVVRSGGEANTGDEDEEYRENEGVNTQLKWLPSQEETTAVFIFEPAMEGECAVAEDVESTARICKQYFYRR